jgi:DNA polymerase III subunit delta'
MAFKDILGQERAINILQGALRHGRLEGCYLFSGPEGVGKKLAAITLAKVLNCAAGADEPCEECVSCKKISAGRHPDIHIIESDGEEIKIDSVRQLQREINLRSYEAKKKVFIVDNAHNLTQEAANALLKVLEEPPAGSLIFLISDKTSLLFKTVISRCKVIKFLPFKREKLEAILQSDYRLDLKNAHFLAYFSEGRLGQALRLKKSDIIRERDLVIDDFIFKHRLILPGASAQGKEDVRFLLNILAAWFRDIYLVKSGAKEQELVNSDRASELSNAAGHFSFPELNGVFETISKSLIFLEGNINIKLLLHNLGAQIWKA